MRIIFVNDFKIVVTLKDKTTRHVEELNADDEKILKVKTQTGEILDISHVECFIVNDKIKTIKDTFTYLDKIFN